MEHTSSAKAEQHSSQKLNNSRPSSRKLSIPSNLIINPAFGDNLVSAPHLTRMRRFSNVGDVTRKLSTTIGWRTHQSTAPPEDVVAIGRALCILYVRMRLKRAGVFNKKLGLTRVKSAVGSLGVNVKGIFPALSAACSELELMHPQLYTRITSKTGATPVGGVLGLLLAIGHHLCQPDLTWGKIISMYCIAGGLAVDCVRKGQHDQLHIILEDMTELFEDRIAYWIQANGNWISLCGHCKVQDQGITAKRYLAIFGLALAIFLVSYFLVRFFVSKY